MNNKTIKIVIGLLLVSAAVLFGLNKYCSNYEMIDVKDSLVKQQKDSEAKFLKENKLTDKPNVILDPYNNSPLSALVMFETETAIAPSVKIEGKDANSTIKHTFKKDTKHYLPIYGLYPDKENNVRLIVGSNSYDLKIKTNKLPKDFILPTNVHADKGALSNDLYFFTPASKGYTAGYDVNGDVRWYLTNKALWQVDRLKNGNLMLSSERIMAMPYYSTGLYEMNMLGKVFNEYSLKGGYHHDYFEMENGHLLIASDDFNNELGTVEDYIIELDPKNGKIVKEIDLKDILKRDDGKSESWSNSDWFHNNSVWYDKKTNSITLSGRHKDAVINIDYSTNKLNWIIGDPTNWHKDYQKYFFKPVGDLEWQFAQHSAKITPEGYVFIFDNGNNKSKNKKDYVKAKDSYSRGVMYKIDTKKMEIQQVWQYGKERKSEFYSPYISEVDYLAKNHYIVHSGGTSYKNNQVLNVPASLGDADKLKSTTVELLNDNPIFEMTLPTNNYRVEKMPLYSNNESDVLQKAKEHGTLGKSPESESYYGPMLNSENIKGLKDNNIELYEEKDRLVVEGKFKKDDDVKVILYKNLRSKEYNVRVKSQTYTAMCVDIFNKDSKEGELQVTKYINKDGLKGEYSIYIEVNDKIYNTAKYVKF